MKLLTVYVGVFMVAASWLISVQCQAPVESSTTKEVRHEVCMGRDGRDGLPGLPGNPGRNGRDGRDGKDGRDCSCDQTRLQNIMDELKKLQEENKALQKEVKDIKQHISTGTSNETVPTADQKQVASLIAATACSRPKQSTIRCPSGWYHHNKNCYVIIKGVHKTWPHAQAECQTYGSNLASITSAKELYTMKMWTQKIPLIWIGLSWKGHDNEGTYHWTDGSVYIPSNNAWSTGEPDAGKDDNCVALRHTGWDDLNCEKYKLPFICKKPAEQVASESSHVYEHTKNTTCQQVCSATTHHQQCNEEVTLVTQTGQSSAQQEATVELYKYGCGHVNKDDQATPTATKVGKKHAFCCCK